ncbi:hypothetical protein METHPM2_1920001 [Pseudomonas sp. PM2]
MGAGLLAKTAWQPTQLDRVYIRYLGNGYLGFRSDSGSLLKSAKVSKTLLPTRHLAWARCARTQA